MRVLYDLMGQVSRNPMRWVNRLLSITMINKPGCPDALESRPLPFKPVGEKVDGISIADIQTKVVELMMTVEMCMNFTFS